MLHANLQYDICLFKKKKVEKEEEEEEKEEKGEEEGRGAGWNSDVVI